MAFKIDLHTHSILSHDGAIAQDEYEKVLSSGTLDCIAITDHNKVAFAQKLQKRLGDKIIVGEEIKAKEGEIIGLFLKEKVPMDLSARQTISAIHKQRGLVYIPHPFETKRSSMQEEVFIKLVDEIDIIEVFNARGRFRGKPDKAIEFARQHNLAIAAASDSHGVGGIGSAYSIVADFPTSKNLAFLLRKATYRKRYAPFLTYLDPKSNKLKRWFRL